MKIRDSFEKLKRSSFSSNNDNASFSQIESDDSKDPTYTPSVAETNICKSNEPKSREQRKMEMILKTIKKMEEATERKQKIISKKNDLKETDNAQTKKSKKGKALQNRQHFVTNYLDKSKPSTPKYSSTPKCSRKENKSSTKNPSKTKSAISHFEIKPIKIAIKKSQFGDKEFYIDNSKFKSNSKTTAENTDIELQSKKFKWIFNQDLRIFFNIIPNISLEYDVTLSCLNYNPKQLYVCQAHKVLLCAASPVFFKLFKDYLNQPKRPIVHLKGISQQVICAILELIYNGSVTVSFEILKDFLRAAEMLKLKGVVNKSNIDNFKIVFEDQSFKQLESKSNVNENTMMLDLTHLKVQYLPVHSKRKSNAKADHKCKAQMEKEALQDIEDVIAGITTSTPSTPKI